MTTFKRSGYMSQTIFSQILSFLPGRSFRRIVKKYGGDYRVRRLTCWSQLLCMFFAQLSYRESLRDIEACLRGRKEELYRMGIRHVVSRSTLADANESRPCSIYAELCRLLMKEAQRLYAKDPFIRELKEAVFILDSTHIGLCMHLCPWAHEAKTGGTVKVHTLLQAAGSIPSFIAISGSKYRDNFILDRIPFEAGAFYIMDKAYFDFKRLHRIHSYGAFFITRIKKGVKVKRVMKLPFDEASGVIRNELIRFVGGTGLKKYRDIARLVVFKNSETQKKLVFVTNNLTLPAQLIAELYRRRWDIEVFFRWIKQNLRIKKFYGSSRNAIETQIWCAISSYLLVTIIKKRLSIDEPLYLILQAFSVSLFEKKPIKTLFSDFDITQKPDCHSNQLNLL